MPQGHDRDLRSGGGTGSPVLLSVDATGSRDGSGDRAVAGLGRDPRWIGRPDRQCASVSQARSWYSTAAIVSPRRPGSCQRPRRQPRARGCGLGSRRTPGDDQERLGRLGMPGARCDRGWGSAWLPRCRPRCSCGSFPTDLDDRPSGRRICSRLRPVTIARQAVGWTARFAGDAGGRSRPDHFLAKSGIRARRGAWRAAGRRRDPTVAWRREWEHVEPEGRMRAPRGGRPTRLFSTRIASTGVMRLDHDRIRIRSWRSRTGDARRQAIRPLRARHRGASPRSDRPRRSPDRRRRG